MFFEEFTWEEEKLGLISGISFVLMGVFGYLLYLEEMTLYSLIFLILAMVAAAGSAVLFQLPRIRGMRAAIGTFLGGIIIGGAIILWVIAASMTPGDIIKMIIIFGVSGIEIVLSFFAVGFLLLALYPPGMEPVISPKTGAAGGEKKEKSHEKMIDVEDEDIFERL